MTEDYRPRSPDFSLPSPQQPHLLASPVASYTPPFFSYQQYQRPNPGRVSQQYIPPYQPDSDMARRSSRLAQSEHIPAPEPMPEAIQPIPDAIAMAPVPDIKPEIHQEMQEMPPAPTSAGIEVKTKFPVARIKRIMQADEDVGKVAQVTPIAVSKALELFMISLVTKAAQEARGRNSKRVTASHLKQAVAKDEVLDFLADIIAKVPDQPAGRKHEDDGSDQNEGRRKRGGRRPKDESD
ncbi:hypothetical protein N7535_001722 [Penicillium sp. DV-2018c]|nr:hypothetical protein N7461_005036 [Penicillium sp. DV-2018c]KAJ5583102.1 hypothetical protein N7535_001722 [Penicillium sp. DV-2018c]